MRPLSAAAVVAATLRPLAVLAANGASCPTAPLENLSVQDVQDLLSTWNLGPAFSAEFAAQLVDGVKLGVLAVETNTFDRSAYPRAQPFDWVALRMRLDKCKAAADRLAAFGRRASAPGRRLANVPTPAGIHIKKPNGGLLLGDDGDALVVRTDDGGVGISPHLMVAGEVTVGADLYVTGAISAPTIDDLWAAIEELWEVVDANEVNIEMNAGDIADNVLDIATNVDDIAANVLDIATNAEDIAVNAADIDTLFDGVAVLDALVNPHDEHAVYVSDFLSDVFTEWKFVGADVDTITCGTYVGIGGNLGNGDSIFTYLHDLPAHSELKVTFTFMSIDSWDGEKATCMLAGTSVWSKTFSGSVGSSGNLCGGTSDERFETVTTTALSHFNLGSTLDFGTTIDQACVAAAAGGAAAAAAARGWPSSGRNDYLVQSIRRGLRLRCCRLALHTKPNNRTVSPMLAPPLCQAH